MKKFICTCIVSIIVSGSSLFAQDITISADSIQTLLCKKWEVDYAVVGGMKIGRMPGAEEINYEFNKDKTFTMSNKDAKEKTKGTWNYDAKKKMIKLTIDGKNRTNVISLNENELVMLVDTTEGAQKDLGPIHIVYKIGNN